MSGIDQRWQLRQLPRELEPARDLWPEIKARIEQRPRRAPRRWLGGLAMAASVLLAAGVFWKATLPPAAPTTDDTERVVVRAETRAITDEYQAALRQFDGAPTPEQIRPSLKTLDQSVLQIRRAIAADPDSVFLLQQLRKTYSRRLALTRRAVTS
jgi:hypothetical protein